MGVYGRYNSYNNYLTIKLFSITFVLYSCKSNAYPDQNQMEFIKRSCDNQQSCEINVWHGGFAACPNCLSSQCPGSSESEFSLWLRYECRGGGLDQSITANSGNVCARPTTPPPTRPPTTRPPTTTTTTMMMMNMPRQGCRHCAFLIFCWNDPTCTNGLPGDY